MKIGLIFGTRPEAIKMAPVYHELKENFEVKVIVTGQHKEMLYQILNIFDIKPDYELDLMKKGQELSELTSRMIISLDQIFKNEKFDYVLVQGDTTSAFTGALVAFYNKVPVAHIEAGLRTGNIYSPFPEEANRKLIGIITTLHFAPTKTNIDNLLKENYKKNNIIETGNTVIDALKWVKKNKQEELDFIKEKYNIKDKKYILLTMHRRENWGRPMEEELTAIRDYIDKKDNFSLVFPMHLNPIVRDTAKKVFYNNKNILLLEPLEYIEFISLLEGAHIVMTDSGGIQEEAPTFGKPTLVLRDTTERPEAIEAGTAILVGTNYDNIIHNLEKLEGDLYIKMSEAKNPYGNGTAALKIRKALEKILNSVDSKN